MRRRGDPPRVPGDGELDRSRADRGDGDTSGGAPRRSEHRRSGAPRRDPRDRIPDVRDGLTRIERVILWQLAEAQKERGGRDVPTAMLYGRVVEHVDISVEELQRALMRLTGKGL